MKRPGSPEPLTEAELARIERIAREQLAMGDPIGSDPEEVIRLVVEVRRLRQLVVDAAPYVPDNEQTQTMDLPARLRAEVDRR